MHPTVKPTALVADAILDVSRRGDIILDPFAGSPPENSLKLPLFLVAFAALVLGVFLGGIAAWFGQGKHRKAARLAKADLARLRAETADDAKPANDR